MAVFYCSRNTAEPERGQPVEILSALLRQLASSKPDVPIRDAVAKEYEIRKKKAEEDCSPLRKLTIRDCTELILHLNTERPAMIILDALDECDEATRHELLKSLDKIISQSESLIKVFISSRDDVDIVSALSSLSPISRMPISIWSDFAAYFKTILEIALGPLREYFHQRLSKRRRYNTLH